MIRLSAEALWGATENQEFWTHLANRMTMVLRQQDVNQAASSPRQIIRTKTGDGLGVMAAIAEQPNTAIMGVKIVSLIRQSTEASPSHPGAVILINPLSGEPQASLDADAVTAIRTAATTCAVTRHIRPTARRFTIIGTGTEARSHLLALSAIYPEARFTIWGRRPESASNLIANHALENMKISVEPNLTEAIRNADVITSLTAARLPFLDMRQVGEAAHVNAIGASVPGLTEWVPESFQIVDILICDDVEECRRQSMEVPADLLKSARNLSTTLEDPSCKNINLSGKRSVYKSVGLAVLDVAASAFLVEQLQP